MLGEGFINIADARGHYSQCLAKTFKTAEEMNEFFKDNPHRLVVYVAQVPEGILTLYAGVLEQKEIRGLQRFGEEIRKKIKEEEAASELAELKLEEEKAKKVEEAKRLAEVGRKCEEHHKPLIEEKRESKKGKK